MLLHYINKLERNTGQQMMLYRYKNYNNILFLKISFLILKFDDIQ